MEATDNRIGFTFHGVFASRTELEREAPRIVNRLAATPHAIWCYDGSGWTLVAMEQYVMFRVVSRHYVTGRGHVTVIDNTEQLPIDKDRAAVCKDMYLLPIHAVDVRMTMMESPEPKPDWGLVTSEETSGDWLTLKMYPDEIAT